MLELEDDISFQKTADGSYNRLVVDKTGWFVAAKILLRKSKIFTINAGDNGVGLKLGIESFSMQFSAHRRRQRP